MHRRKRRSRFERSWSGPPSAPLGTLVAIVAGCLSDTTRGSSKAPPSSAPNAAREIIANMKRIHTLSLLALSLTACGNAPLATDRDPATTEQTLLNPNFLFGDAPSPVKMLIVTSSELAPSLQRLATHKTNTMSFPSYVVRIGTLKDAFPGLDDPEVIKRAIRYFKETKGTQYVLLGGSPAHVPVRRRYVRANAPPDMTGTFNPSDLYYSNLYHHDANGVAGAFDDWDQNGNGLYNEQRWIDDTQSALLINPDNVDGFPDLALGRVPAANLAEMDGYVDKVISYELMANMPGAGRFVFFEDKLYEGADTLANAIETSVAGTTNRHYGLNYGNEPAPAPYVAQPNAMVADAASRASWLTYVGHGFVSGWDGVDAATVAGAVNRGNFPVVLASACETGAFAPWKEWAAGTTPNPYEGSRSFASDWLFSSTGAIAYFGEVGVAQNNWGTDLGQRMLARYAAGNFTLGDIWRGGQERYWRDFPNRGEVIGASRIYLGFMTFFGDPSLRLRTQYKMAKSTVSDFDGDGKSDLVWHNPTTGSVFVWKMDGFVHQGDINLGRTATAPWRLAGMSDFTGDGKLDAIWHNTSTGDIYIWPTNDGPDIYVGNVSAAAGWFLGAVNDMNGDNRPDLVWQNKTTGDTYIWPMNGGVHVGPDVGPIGVTASPWELAGSADFTGDGKADLVWQNRTTGDIYVWTMNGMVHAGPDIRVGSAAAPWRIGATADFTKDGQADLVFHNETSGDTYIWPMQSTQHVSPDLFVENVPGYVLAGP
jgi:hypothetical protein